MNKTILNTLTILSYVSILVSIFVLTLLALDVFTIPYLTPFAHFLRTIISPFVPLIMPLYIGTALKIYKHASFPSRRQCLFQAGCFIFQQTPRAAGDLARLYDWGRLWDGRGVEGMLGVCGLKSCMGSWVEAALMVGVLFGEWRGARWDADYVQKMVDAMAEESIRKERERSGEVEMEMDVEVERMEKGEGIEDGSLEGESDEKDYSHEP